MNGFGYSEQQKKKSLNDGSKYVTTAKSLKTVDFSDLKA